MIVIRACLALQLAWYARTSPKVYTSWKHSYLDHNKSSQNHSREFSQVSSHQSYKIIELMKEEIQEEENQIWQQSTYHHRLNNGHTSPKSLNTKIHYCRYTERVSVRTESFLFTCSQKKAFLSLPVKCFDSDFRFRFKFSDVTIQT